MSDANSARGSLDGDDEPKAPPGLFEDRVVRRMSYASLLLVILFLAAVIGVMATGVATPTGPRSAAERQVLIAQAQAEGATGEAAAPYITSLVAAGNLPAARVALAQARASLGATTPASDLDLAEARLLNASAEYDRAVLLADRAMQGYVADYELLSAKGDEAAAAAAEFGYGPDYFNAVLVKARALAELRRWDEAVTTLDIYIEEHPTAADILVERATAKAASDDAAGAEADYRAALKFVPYDEAAQDGLRKLGVER